MAGIVLYHWSLAKELTAQRELAKPWKLVVETDRGFSEIRWVSVYPRRRYGYNATYGKTTVWGRTTHLAALNLAHALQWEVILIHYPDQDGEFEDGVRYAINHCDVISSDFSELARGKGNEKYTPRECGVVAETARMIGDRIQNG